MSQEPEAEKLTDEACKAEQCSADEEQTENVNEAANEVTAEIDSDVQQPDHCVKAAEKKKSRSGRRRAPVRTVKELEEEGDIAADYLEELLDIIDFGGDIDIDVENDRALVEIIADGEDARDLDRLVGEDGEVLDALQDLTRLAVYSQTRERSRLMLDICGFRAERRTELQNIASEAVLKCETTGKPVKLSPMNPFERKVCHDVVAAAGLVSESEGEDRHRAVVVYPASEK